MIPKIIHYCWFGSNPIPDSVEKCIDSWKKNCPDYRIIRWDESNYELNNIYIRQAYENKKYAFVTDYVRLDVVSKYGGIYLDTDVELLRGLDELLKFDSFFGMEEAGRVNTGLCFGAVKNNKIVEDLKEVYNHQKFIINGKENRKTCVEYSVPIFKNMGLVDKDIVQKLDNERCYVFSTRYFCPKNFESGRINLDKVTYSIHHFDSTWKKKSIGSHLIVVVKIRLRHYLNMIFGNGTYEKIKDFLKD